LGHRIGLQGLRVGEAGAQAFRSLSS
jgi:hypothetical protein